MNYKWEGKVKAGCCHQRRKKIMSQKIKWNEWIVRRWSESEQLWRLSDLMGGFFCWKKWNVERICHVSNMMTDCSFLCIPLAVKIKDDKRRLLAHKGQTCQIKQRKSFCSHSFVVDFCAASLKFHLIRHYRDAAHPWSVIKDINATCVQR